MKQQLKNYLYILLIYSVFIVLTIPLFTLFILMIRSILSYRENPFALEFILRKVTVLIVIVSSSYFASFIMKVYYNVNKLEVKFDALIRTYRKDFIVILVIIFLNSIMFVFYPPCGILRYLLIILILTVSFLIAYNINFLKKYMPIKFN